MGNRKDKPGSGEEEYKQTDRSDHQQELRQILSESSRQGVMEGPNPNEFDPEDELGDRLSAVAEEAVAEGSQEEP